MASGLKHKGTKEHVEQLKPKIFFLTQRHYKHSTIRKFVNNLYYRDADNLFRCNSDAVVPYSDIEV